MRWMEVESKLKLWDGEWLEEIMTQALCACILLCPHALSP